MRAAVAELLRRAVARAWARFWTVVGLEQDDDAAVYDFTPDDPDGHPAPEVASMGLPPSAHVPPAALRHPSVLSHATHDCPALAAECAAVVAEAEAILREAMP